jgi:NhaP-type Na+/H+ or K+/H+ antiporter
MGLGSALLILFLMALKTGLHAHGPEFSAIEVSWVLQQIPLWAAAGLAGGLGVGLLLRWVFPPAV